MYRSSTCFSPLWFIAAWRYRRKQPSSGLGRCPQLFPLFVATVFPQPAFHLANLPFPLQRPSCYPCRRDIVLLRGVTAQQFAPKIATKADCAVLSFIASERCKRLLAFPLQLRGVHAVASQSSAPRYQSVPHVYSPFRALPWCRDRGSAAVRLKQ